MERYPFKKAGYFSREWHHCIMDLFLYLWLARAASLFFGLFADEIGKRFFQAPDTRKKLKDDEQEKKIEDVLPFERKVFDFSIQFS